MLLTDLGGAWKMRRTDESGWTGASVPGSVYADLLKAGKMEDPFYRDNEEAAFELCRHDYEYERKFRVTGDMLAHEKVFLLCEGLDTLCDLFLNGKRILSADNMHRAYETDVKRILAPGENTLRAVFRSPVNYALEKQKESPLINVGEAIPGISHLRKAHYMFGWDWGPHLPDMGVWRPISLRGYDAARLAGVRVAQQHSPGRVDLDLKIGLERWSGGPLPVTARITPPGGAALEQTAQAGGGTLHLAFRIDRPQLWWPNNLGAHPLYGVKVTLGRKEAPLDETSFSIGLRTLTVRREKDKYGESFAFTANGVPFFAMGADYIPEDNILSRLSRGRTERLIRDCARANFNAIRVWGGGFYAEDYFYDLCDRYGLVVWQDLMYACGAYELTDAFRDSIAAETVQNVARLRNHASLGLWCGNNEQEWEWRGWREAGRGSPKLQADYIKMYEVLLPELVRSTDPNTSWWPSSPSSGGCFDDPNGQERGDMHYWGVWHGREPFTSYRSCFPRFMSEFGLQSFPCLKTVESFTLPEDRNIFSYVMESHQRSGTGNEKILYYISQNYRYPKDFDSLLYASQLIQAEGVRYGVEHWRRNRGRCMGAIYWQLNDCWPAASWSSIDSRGRWKALHYAARRFFAPVLASACEEGTRVSLHVSNESPAAVSGTLRWKLTDAACRTIDRGEAEVSVGAFSTRECRALDYAALLGSKAARRGAVLFYGFEAGGRSVSGGTVLFVKPKHFSFLDPKIDVDVREEGDRFILTLAAKAYARFVELRLAEADAVFSDNYFDLDASRGAQVELLKSDLSQPLTLGRLKDQLRVRSLFDAG